MFYKYNIGKTFIRSKSELLKKIYWILQYPICNKIKCANGCLRLKL